MPSYDYHCPANGQTLEVKHRISESIATWGELCTLANIETGDVTADAPVQKLANGGQVVNRASLNNPVAPPCATGPCCGGGMCDF